MEYTNEMFEEDKRIAQYIFKKSYSKYAEFRDDMIQLALIKLSRARETFCEEKGSYFGYASKTCVHAFNAFLIREYKQTNQGNNLSLDIEHSDDASTLQDFIGVEENPLKEMEFDQLKKMVYGIIVKPRRKDILKQKDPKRNFKKLKKGLKTQQKYAIEYFINGKSVQEIADEKGTTKQTISTSIVKYRKIIKEELQKRGYFQ